VSQADDAADGTYYVHVSATSTKRMVVVHYAGKAWAMVMLKVGQTSAITTDNAFGDSSNDGTFKLSDVELNYMTTASNNPDVIGVVLIPNYNNGYRTGNLLRSNDGSRAFPIGGGNTANAGDMAKFDVTSPDPYPTNWDTNLEDNTHCGSNQVWANWASDESYMFRWTSNNGCSYFNANVNGVTPGDYTGRIYALLH